MSPTSQGGPMRDILKFEAGEEFHVWFPTEDAPIMTRGVEDRTFSDILWFIWNEDLLERAALSDGAIAMMSQTLEAAIDLRVERVCALDRDKNEITVPAVLNASLRDALREHISNFDGIKYRFVHA